MKKRVRCGRIEIGGTAPISIQSMLNVDTRDIKAAVGQIQRLEEVGCQIVRLAIPDEEAAAAFGEIKKQVGLPLVADIHFDYRLALAAIKNGADKVRINPGNIGSRQRVEAVVHAAKERNIPIRVGVNSGSLEKDLLQKYGGPTAEALAQSALRNVRILEDLNFEDIVISLKSSDVRMNDQAYRIVDRQSDYPLHIGVTEAGTVYRGEIKSAVGIGALLLSGIGNTMRVSLTGDPVAEVITAKKILSAVGLGAEPIDLISCPTCGRTTVNLEKLCLELERELAPIGSAREKAGKPPLKIAVMGCEVNGPGEAAGADLGVACGKGKGAIFSKGKILKTVEEEKIKEELMRMVKEK